MYSHRSRFKGYRDERGSRLKEKLWVIMVVSYKGLVAKENKTVPFFRRLVHYPQGEE